MIRPGLVMRCTSLTRTGLDYSLRLGHDTEPMDRRYASTVIGDLRLRSPEKRPGSAGMRTALVDLS